MPTCRFPISMMLSLLEPTESALNSRETLYSFPNFERVSSRLFLVGVISRNIEFILFSPSLPPWPRFTCGGSELDQIKTGHVKFYQIQHPSRLYVLCRYQVTLSKANCVCRMVKQKYGTETFIVICIMYLLIEENVFAMSETLNWVGGGKFETVWSVGLTIGLKINVSLVFARIFNNNSSGFVFIIYMLPNTTRWVWQLFIFCNDKITSK